MTPEKKPAGKTAQLPTDQTKSLLIRARDKKKEGDDTEAKKLAKSEYDSLLRREDYKGAIEVINEFSLPRELTKNPASNLVRIALDSNNYNDIVALVDKYKLDPTLGYEAAIELHKQYVENSNLVDAQNIRKKFQIKKEHYAAPVLKYFKKQVVQGQIDRAIKLKNSYNLTSEDLMTVLQASVEHLLSHDQFEDTQNLVKAFSLKGDILNEIAIKTYNRFIKNADYSGAAQIAVDFGLDSTLVAEAGQMAFSLAFQTNKIKLAKNLLQKYKLSGEDLDKKIKDKFIKELNNGNMERVLEMKTIFGIKNEISNPLIIPVIKLKIRSKSFDYAHSLFKDFSIPLEEILPEILDAFKTQVNRAGFKSATSIKVDFELQPVQYTPIIQKSFEDRIKTGKYEIAKTIMKEYSLDSAFVEPIARKVYDEYVKKHRFESALVFGKDFKIDTGSLTEVAWNLFSRKLELHDYPGAARVTKMYKIPSEKLKTALSAHQEDLEKKNKFTQIENLRRVFNIQKKGLLSKLFGR